MAASIEASTQQTKESLAHAQHRYFESQEAVLELAEFAVAQVIALDDPAWVAQKITSHILPDDFQGDARAAYDAVHEFWQALTSEITAELRKESASSPDGSFQDETDAEASRIRVTEKLNERVSELASSMQQALERSGVGTSVTPALLSRYLQKRVRRPRVALMLESLLISSVGDFEVLIATLIREHYLFQPEALARGTQYSFAEIAAYDSLEEFKAFAVDRQVDSIMRGDMNAWLDILRQATRANEGRLNNLSSPVMEVLQRRHILVHNGGHVSRSYLAKVKPGGDVNLGQHLGVSVAYLRESLELMAALAGYLVHLCQLAVTRTLKDSAEQIEKDLANFTMSLLQSERYKSVIALSSACLPSITNGSCRQIVQVNNWIARKKINGIPSVREEIAKWDVSSLDRQYKLAKMALLEEHLSEAHDLASKLIEQKSLTQTDYDIWALLEPVRKWRAEQSIAQIDLTETTPMRDVVPQEG